ncbi:hypothetical protein BB561_006137 [Smittium simulii]|uniref:Uncharacterized protein n=1 Tax=Smittium simulii TaxID=133385 RepID=A0A2T9Y6E6_9FUNG|nr:hypothetical protein BB561_006137 [Smittium simulii]
MPKVSGVIPSAAAGVPLIPTKRTRLEYSTAAKTVLIDPASPNPLGSLRAYAALIPGKEQLNAGTEPAPSD